MSIAPDQLPDDVTALKKRVVDQAARNEQLQSQITVLQEQLTIALAKRYAASSEKISPDQIRLFDEAATTVHASPYRAVSPGGP